jgi:hypothetical protein
MLRKSLLLVCSLAVFVGSVFSQAPEAKTNTKLSIDLNYGIPVTFFSINSGLVAIYGVGARYSFSPTISVAAKYNSFAFVNNSTGNSFGSLSSNPISSTDVIKYNNKFKSLNVFAQYNLHKLLGMDQLTSRFIPYVSVGGGLLIANKFSSTLVDGNVYGDKNFKFSPMITNYQFGGGVRYYLNSFVDLTLSSEFNYVETYYLDGAYSDKKLDSYLNTYLGVNFKIGAKKSHNLLDWSHKDQPDEIREKYDFSKMSVDAHLGLPILFTGVGYSPSLGGGANFRYSLTRAFSLQANLGWYKYRGTQEVGNSISTGFYREVGDIKHFNTLMTNFGIRTMFNINQIGEMPSEKRVWNHYISLGVGINNFNQDLDLANGTTIENIKYRWKTSNAVVGYQARKYINSEFDFMAGLDFNYNQSFWLDGAPKDTKLDHSIYLFAGVSYKIGAKGGKELIDWTYSNYNWTQEKKSIPLSQVPIIDKPTIEEPAAPEAPKAPETPNAPEPVVETPKPAEPVIVETTKPAEPVVVETPKPTPAPNSTPAPKPVVKPVPAEPSTPSPVYVASSEIAPPPMKYNVIVACYSANKANIAQLAKANLEKKGYTPSLYQDPNSRMLRMALISTDSKAEALEILRKARKVVDANSWIHLYNKQ